MAGEHHGHTYREHTCCGHVHATAMTVEALAEIERHDPFFGKLIYRIADGTWSIGDLRTVLGAGLRAGGAAVSAQDVIDAEGLTRASEIAYQAFSAAFDGPEDAEGNAPAGSETTSEASASTSASISGSATPSD